MPAAASGAAECPHCGAGLQRAEPGADGRILCLNCGKRFAPSGAAPSSNAEQQASSQAADRVAEPVPPAYGYLRAAGILAFLTGLAGLAMAGYEPFTRLIRWDLNTGVSLGCLGSVFCFLAGAMVLRTIWDLLRLDGLHGALAWQRGRVKSPLAPLRGTSLLYILPPASLGGMVGLYLMTDGLNTENGFRAGAGVVTIAAGLLAAFSAENLRLLLWRQVQWAARLRGLNDLPPPRAWNGSTLLWLPLLAGLLVLVVMILDRTRRYGAFNAAWGVIWLGGFFAVGLAALLLLRNLAASMRAWHDAEETQHRRDPLLMAVAYLPVLYCLSGSGWMILCAYQMRNYLDAEFVLMLSGVCLVSGSLALFLGRLAIELARWRRAQETLLEAQPGSFWTGVNGHLAFWLLLTGLVGCAIFSYDCFLSILNLSLAFALTWTDVMQTVTSDFCAALIILYLPLWCLAILRETRLSVAAAEQALARANEPRTPA
ncbi:MAG: hypothetical protein KIS92_10395 [Planctomycetota bacterium]|nr:hypothetical protein [Planctomycetota bacterium]